MNIDIDRLKQNFVPTVKKCLTEKYMMFHGDATQEEFITFMTFSFLVWYVSYLILPFSITGILMIALLCPSLATTSRRLNHAGLPMTLMAFILLPVMNILFVVYLATQPGKARR